MYPQASSNMALAMLVLCNTWAWLNLVFVRPEGGINETTK
jgi:hypothetical protein